MEEAEALARIKRRSGVAYIVASDDLKVQELGRKHSWVSDVCWIEQVRPCYSVSDNVQKINGTIEQWLTSLTRVGDRISAELLEWPCVVEGGLTSQRIQDTLLLIDSYLLLIDTYLPEEIMLLLSGETLWEDMVLIETAKSRRIPVRTIGRFRRKVVFHKWKERAKLIARLPYYIADLMRARFGSRREKKDGIFSNEVAFQLCGSNNRHIENIQPVMQSLEKRGYHCVALCWRAGESTLKVRRQGFPTVSLEKFVSLLSIGSALFAAFKTFMRARRNFKQFWLREDFFFRGVPLAKPLWPSILYFFSAEVPMRHMLKTAIEMYFQNHSPLAIKLWAGGAVLESDLVIRSRKKSWEPLYVHWVLGIIGDDPYESSYSGIDLFLTSGQHHANYLVKRGFPENRIVSVGMSRYGHLPTFRNKHDRNQSRINLGIPIDYSFYILHDAGAIMRGYYSRKEQVQSMDILLRFAQSRPAVALLVKPHPSHHSGALEHLIRSYALKNVFMIDKNALPYHAINASDVVIIKYSTLGLEAMLFERPFISLILDGEERFKIYGDAAEYIMHPEQCISLLTRLNDDVEFRLSWQKDQIQRQKEFLKGYFVDDPRPPAELAAEAIDLFIKRRFFQEKNERQQAC